MTNTARTEPPEPMLTRDEILYIAKKMANDRNWGVKLALAVIECRLDAARCYQEAELAYSLLNEEITKGL
jgi:HD superfamily phosphohydrolase YqeK